jgi:hypothetical protein
MGKAIMNNQTILIVVIVVVVVVAVLLGGSGSPVPAAESGPSGGFIPGYNGGLVDYRAREAAEKEKEEEKEESGPAEEEYAGPPAPPGWYFEPHVAYGAAYGYSMCAFNGRRPSSGETCNALYSNATTASACALLCQGNGQVHFTFDGLYNTCRCLLTSAGRGEPQPGRQLVSGSYNNGRCESLSNRFQERVTDLDLAAKGFKDNSTFENCYAYAMNIPWTTCIEFHRDAGRGFCVLFK